MHYYQKHNYKNKKYFWEILVSIIIVISILGKIFNLDSKIKMLVLTFLIFIFGIFNLLRDFKYAIKYEPLFTYKNKRNYIDLSKIKGNPDDNDDSICNKLSDILDGDGKTKYRYSIKPSKKSIAFTMSFWIYIYNIPNSAKWSGSFNSHRIIFSFDQFLGGSPVMTYHPPTGEIYIWILTGFGISYYNIGRIKLQKWVHLVTTLDNRNLDIFLNGEFYKGFKLPNVPIIGTKKVSFGPNGGLFALVAIPRYYNRPLEYNEIYLDYMQNKYNTVPDATFFWFINKPSSLMNSYPMGNKTNWANDDEMHSKPEVYQLGLVAYSDKPVKDYTLLK